MRILRTFTVKRVSADGLVSLEDGVLVGREYVIDIDTALTVQMFNVEFGIHHEKQIVDTVNVEGRRTGWLPVELLALD